MTIFTLAKLAESRSPRRALTSSGFANTAGPGRALSRNTKYRDDIDADYVHLIYLTSPLHDIGKVGIPDSVLLKAGPLTDKEFEIMKSHVRIGADTLDAAGRLPARCRIPAHGPRYRADAPRAYDGSGYPQGLVRDEIPLVRAHRGIGRRLRRAHREARLQKRLTHDVAKSVISKRAGVHFDPDIVDAFLEAEKEFINIQKRFADPESADYVVKIWISLRESPLNRRRPPR